jgi:beta-glucosidase/6-phospho-beta-glucosidase/beta-galactosidase
MAWFSDPILTGVYPESMRQRLGERMPVFSPQEQCMINGSLDYFALNHYSSFVVTHHPNHIYDFVHDVEVEYSNPPYRARADSRWLYEVPEGIAHMIHWLSQRYRGYFDNHTMIISENGVSMHNYVNPYEDQFRIRFLSSYLTEATKSATINNVSLSHFFIWSLMDNFEWASGYTERFGLVYIDFNDPNRPRTLKYSVSKWLKNQ